MKPAPDPVTLSVLDNRFRAIVEEMGEAMLRTACTAKGMAPTCTGM